MKKLLRKIRNKRLKGNVSLLVILILLASSVISLLSINQIQRLLSYGNMTFNYFRAFYLAKAGTELWLTEVYYRGDGFNQVLSGDFITTWNFLSGYEWFEPHFNMTITGSFATLTNDIRDSECSWNKIKLATWAGIMLSLFSDNTQGMSLKEILSGDIKPNNLEYFRNLSLSDSLAWDSELTFAFFTYSNNGEMTDIVVSTWKDLKDFLKNKSIPEGQNWYLTIKNSWAEDVEFCIYKDWALIPYSDFLITVFWHYGDMEVGLQSVVKKWVPDWTLNVLDENPSS